MTDNITYQVDKDSKAISEQKMRFDIVNRLPSYPAAEKESVKADIEKQLFAIFCKYEYAH